MTETPRAWARQRAACSLKAMPRWLSACGSLFLAGAATAGPLGSESSIGLSASYSSNPFLQFSQARTAESEALLVNLPLTYSGSEQTIDLIPRLRLAETQGGVSLLSNYQYLDGDWQMKGERNVFLANAFWHRDSTYYNEFENGLLGGRDLHRKEEDGVLGWRRLVDERSDLQLNVSADHVSYYSAFAATLTSYEYDQASLQFDRYLTERWQWTLAAGYGRYRVLNYAFDTDTRFAQSSITHMLSEQWSLTAQVGYSFLNALQEASNPFLYLCIVDNQLSECVGYATEQQHYARGTPSYSVTFERRGERLVLDLAASRLVEPSGVGALLTQSDESIKVSYPWTQRWTLSATLHASTASDTLQRLNFGNRHFYDADAGIAWQWTDHWIAQLGASYNLQALEGRNANNVSVSLNLLRQLGRVAF